MRPRYAERSEVEALIFSVNAALKELKQSTFLPRDGYTLHDLETAWQGGKCRICWSGENGKVVGFGRIAVFLILRKFGKISKLEIMV